jgi:hypothetical protein
MLTDLLATVPQPPIDARIPKSAESIFNVFLFIPVAIGLVVAAANIARGKGPLLLYCLIGGLLSAVWEPIVDVLGLCYIKEQGAMHVFSVLGRSMPLYICFVYTWYVGGLAYFTSTIFQCGVTMRGLLKLWALIGVVDIVMETPGIVLGAYVYYGQQPMNYWGFPMWWALVNPLMPMIGGALIYKLKPRLTDARRLLAVIALVPMGDGLANAASGFPMWAALNQTDVSLLWTHLAVVPTLGLALLSVWVIGLAISRPTKELGDLTLSRNLTVHFRRTRAQAPQPSVPAAPAH